MENGTGIFASLKVVIKREFAIMQILEKESGLPSSLCRSCSDCIAGR